MISNPVVVALFGGVLLCASGCERRKGFELKGELKPCTVEEVVGLSAEELERVDVGRMNLICAQAAGGDLDLAQGLAELDRWAEQAANYEKKYRKTFERNPARYDNSYAKYRAVNLALMVNVEMKCRYQKQLMRSGAMDDVRSPRFFRNPDDVFVTGLLKKRLGTCSSFPVLLVALGRRLGYPMSLKVTREHMFCEWNDGVERFNLESNGDGVDSPPDDFYRSDGRETGKLTVLNNVQTLGVFLETAGYCLEACGDVAKAIGVFKLAVRYRPDDANLRRLANRQHLGKRG